MFRGLEQNELILGSNSLEEAHRKGKMKTLWMQLGWEGGHTSEPGTNKGGKRLDWLEHCPGEVTPGHRGSKRTGKGTGTRYKQSVVSKVGAHTSRGGQDDPLPWGKERH